MLALHLAPRLLHECTCHCKQSSPVPTLAAPIADRQTAPFDKERRHNTTSLHRPTESTRGADGAPGVVAQRPGQAKAGNTGLARASNMAASGPEQAARWEHDHQPKGQLDRSQHGMHRQHPYQNLAHQPMNRNTDRDRLQGRFVVPHSSQVTRPMSYSHSAYPQAWPSHDQQRTPGGGNPFRGHGKWKHDLFEELTKPAEPAGQADAQQTAAHVASITPGAAAGK